MMIKKEVMQTYFKFTKFQPFVKKILFCKGVVITALFFCHIINKSIHIVLIEINRRIGSWIVNFIELVKNMEQKIATQLAIRT